jgi:hypothetical protein
MMRRFAFEDGVHNNLGCVPMGVRRKLDRAGIKISLEQWQALGLGERLALCHLPVESEEERQALRVFTDEAIKAKSGQGVRILPEASRAAAEPPDHPPARLVEHARVLGVTLNQPAWDKLDVEERYALIKLGDALTASHNLAAALAEFVR